MLMHDFVTWLVVRWLVHMRAEVYTSNWAFVLRHVCAGYSLAPFTNVVEFLPVHGVS